MENIYENLEARLQNTYSIKDEYAYNQVGTIQDYHGNVQLLSDTAHKMSYEAGEKDFYMILGDIPDKKKTLEIGAQFGIQDEASMEMNYYAAHMDEESRDLFGYVKTIEMHGGIDKYLSLLSYSYPGVDLEAEKKRYDEVTSKYNESNIESLIEAVKKEKGDEIESLKGLTRDTWGLLDEIVTDEYLTGVADFTNEFNYKAQKEGRGKMHILACDDNHTTTSEKKRLKEMVQYGDVHNIADVSGAIELGNGDDKFSFQCAGNMTNVFQHVDSYKGLSSEEQMGEYPHMFNASFQEDIDVEAKDNLNPEYAFMSWDLYRITNGGRDLAPLDHMFLHMEPEYNVGAMGFEGKSSPYGRYDDVGVLWLLSNMMNRDDEGYASVTSGHIHAPGHSRNLEMMLDKARGPSFIVGKEGRVTVGSDEGYAPMEINLESISKSMEEGYAELLKKYGFLEEVQSSAAADDWYDADSKAA